MSRPTAKSLTRFALLLFTFGVGLTGCGKDQAGGPQRPATEVGYITVQPQPLVLQSELAGRTRPYLMSEVRPQVSGIIKSRRFEEGAQVKAGEVLYEIDPAPYEAAVAEAKAALANAKAAVDAARLKDQRYSELLAIEGVSQQEADDAKTAHAQAVAQVAQMQATLASAQINLEYTRVRAPISGRIGISSITPGALVTANQETALATIRTLDPIYVDMTQSSAEMLKLRRLMGETGMKSGRAKVHLKLEDGSAYQHPGSMKFAEVAVDVSTGSVTLRAEFPNPDGVLLPGMYVRAVLDQATNTHAILAPQQGVTRDLKGNATALVLTPDDKVEQRTLVAERAIGDRWLISQGLAVGDRLIVEGTNKIRVGDTVNPVDVGSGAKAAAAEAAPATSGG
ncbi:efflux RND transporter periplasmic adaptor subunit [Steroidobacter sp. S1-65]|uniref:Efflux RND transporter periplasmic adaptor subunit n=1 Tax=Steroidobacter gossypii TaxID=2805490 RepID=A0ABS1WZ69_9GAMM|nr:efflux RND transporter periplasmic adaptor subunit [Steroidobacter gossypii]MBM0106275.1 efflux RND transporter periplasmic adaptor subunit [Steroidobacter gossypii]